MALCGLVGGVAGVGCGRLWKEDDIIPGDFRWQILEERLIDLNVPLVVDSGHGCRFLVTAWKACMAECQTGQLSLSG